MRVVKPVSVVPGGLGGFSPTYTIGGGFEFESVPPWTFTSYVTGDLVSFEGFIYQALTGISMSSSNQPPPMDVIRWAKVRPLKQHAPFDNQTSTANRIVYPSTQGTYTITVPVNMFGAVAKIDVIGIFNIKVFRRVRLSVIRNSVVVYVEEKSLIAGDFNNWYDYFYGESEPVNEVVFDGLEPYLTGETSYQIEFFVDQFPYDGIAEVGTIVIGKSLEIGKTQMNPSVGIVDYSRKTTDEFGVTEFVVRAFSKRVSVQIMIPNGSLNKIYSALAQLRATPCLWLGTSMDEYGPLNVFGYYKDFNIAIPYVNDSLVSIEIEGLA